MAPRAREIGPVEHQEGGDFELTPLVFSAYYPAFYVLSESAC